MGGFTLKIAIRIYKDERHQRTVQSSDLIRTDFEVPTSTQSHRYQKPYHVQAKEVMSSGGLVVTTTADQN